MKGRHQIGQRFCRRDLNIRVQCKSIAIFNTTARETHTYGVFDIDPDLGFLLEENNSILASRRNWKNGILRVMPEHLGLILKTHLTSFSSVWGLTFSDLFFLRRN
jgi:hypothetical protein